MARVRKNPNGESIFLVTWMTLPDGTKRRSMREPLGPRNNEDVCTGCGISQRHVPHRLCAYGKTDEVFCNKDHYLAWLVLGDQNKYYQQRLREEEMRQGLRRTVVHRGAKKSTAASKQTAAKSHASSTAKRAPARKQASGNVTKLSSYKRNRRRRRISA